jgi:hypothetical protein
MPSSRVSTRGGTHIVAKKLNVIDTVRNARVEISNEIELSNSLKKTNNANQVDRLVTKVPSWAMETCWL